MTKDWEGSTELRILTLTQPWATLWACGAKLIETRSWSTPYRGRVAVHAAREPAPNMADLCAREPFASALAHAGYDKPEDLPRSAIVGVVGVVACLRMRSHHVDIDHDQEMCLGRGCDRRLTETERAFGAYVPGRWAWMTDTAWRRRFPFPFPYRGAQGLRRLPDNIVGAVMAAAATGR